MKKMISIIGLMLLVISYSSAQEAVVKPDTVQKGKNVIVKVKEGVNAVVFIDGKKYDSEILEILDPEKIEKMEVFKGEEAKKKFDTENAIVITTKVKAGSRIVIRGVADTRPGTEKPVIIVDGKVCDSGILDTISPEDIQSVQVLKDEKSLEKYNTTVGVIFVKTKKKE
ncbi:MAG: TonB-dependent receptor plug domain-containing protein [Bacteroidales bacterium]